MLYILLGTCEVEPQNLLCTADIQGMIPHIDSVKTCSIYFVTTRYPLDLRHKERLARLLNVPVSLAEVTSLEPNQCIIMPRRGRVSPWSSQATDLCHCADLRLITRLEHGRLITMKLRDEGVLDNHHWSLLDGLIQDMPLEKMCRHIDAVRKLFADRTAASYKEVDVLGKGEAALRSFSRKRQCDWTQDDIRYLSRQYQHLKRNPTDVELMTFALMNSEHCRHKFFNARWQDKEGFDLPKTLFQMIKETQSLAKHNVLSVESEEVAVVEGPSIERLFPQYPSQLFQYLREPIAWSTQILHHSHRTGVAPFPGAATGVGEALRDEGAVGRGGKPIAGLLGLSISNLQLPDGLCPWEQLSDEMLSHHVTPLQIILDAPLGAARYANEFGRPTILGYLRTYQQDDLDSRRKRTWGYHKPMMLSGGLGQVRPDAIDKQNLVPGMKILVIGGPALLVGLGGVTAAAHAYTQEDDKIDLASVQRANPQMGHRCQEVIDACWQLGTANPIASINDVGAGGIACAIAKLLQRSEQGGEIELRAVPVAEAGLTPLELWCNEAQERYVMAVRSEHLGQFIHIASRERCPYAIIGTAVVSPDLIVFDQLFDNYPVSLPLAGFFEDVSSVTKTYFPRKSRRKRVDPKPIDLTEAARRILMLPSVGDKSFLTHICDRSVGGLVARDPCVGPWQVPVSDVAVVAAGFRTIQGRAMAIGERAPIAVIDPAAAARVAAGEALTNIAAACIEKVQEIHFSASWAAATGEASQDMGLYAAVEGLTQGICKPLGIPVSTNQHALSMETKWSDDLGKHHVSSPPSVVITANAPVKDIQRTLTPELVLDKGETRLILIDLSDGIWGLGGSCLAQVYQQIGKIVPDVKNPSLLLSFFHLIQELNKESKLLAYHDRSDGGLFVTLCEMTFASHCGLSIDLPEHSGSDLMALFHEGLGAVVQIFAADLEVFYSIARHYEMGDICHDLGEPTHNHDIVFKYAGQTVLADNWMNWKRQWSITSYRISLLRDHPDCARQAYFQSFDHYHKGLSADCPKMVAEDISEFLEHTGRPKVAILREQGTSGQLEMAAAIEQAGFMPVDVPMADLIEGRATLAEYYGLMVCGGFSYADVLGAGRGWAQVVLNQPKLRQQFEDFFARPSTFTLGVCNGCQMLSQLRDLIPGADQWPVFKKNTSGQFESRLVMVKVEDSASIFFQGMSHAVLPVIIAHGEGRAEYGSEKDSITDSQNACVSLKYVDCHHMATEAYPDNPNGSTRGIAGLTAAKGRVTIMMPHPERCVRSVQLSWHPEDWQSDTPWMAMFTNMRRWVDPFVKEDQVVKS